MKKQLGTERIMKRVQEYQKELAYHVERMFPLGFP
jgi:hypothetical protein